MTTEIPPDAAPEIGLVLKYFVLKPKGTDAHATASRIAMASYATAIASYDHDLASQLTKWVKRERLAASDERRAQADLGRDERARIMTAIRALGSILKGHGIEIKVEDHASPAGERGWEDD